ncbi:transposable element Tcb1 transposase [Trichonephila clavipes]|nr:transposable element Tcb1 transposase [Trichonephila clavipes]
MHSHIGPAPSIMVFGDIGFQCCTPLLHIAGTLSSESYISRVLEPVGLPCIQRLPSVIFQHDKVQSPVARKIQEFFFTHQIELPSWFVCSPDLSSIGKVWPMLAQRLSRNIPLAATPYQLWQYVEAAWAAVPQGCIQTLLILCRCMWQRL